MRRINSLPSCLVLGAVAAAMTIPVVVEAQSGRPAMITAKREMAAFFDGPRCADAVKMIFKGKDIKYFKSDQPIAARLINNVATLIRGQCPNANQISARGLVQGKIVYTGIAEAATDWTVVELGVSKNIGSLSGGRVEGSKAGEKEKFKGGEGFLPISELVKLGSGKPFLCTRYDAKTKTCSAITDIGQVSSDGGKIKASSLIKAAGDPVVNFSDNVNSGGGFMCLNPQKSSVAITGGKLSPGARKTMETDFKDRAADKGDEICIGYQRNGEKLFSEYFDKEGYSVAEKSEVTLFAAAPGLRLDE